METIDKRITKVIMRENNNLTLFEKESIDKVLKLNADLDFIKPEYTITPKDTIGKSIFFNTIRS
jgi:hypothetical protein